MRDIVKIIVAAAAVGATPALAGELFRDCPECPEMVIVPAGTFMMGSHEAEEGRWEFEGPRRRVAVQAFAIGRHEVTFAEWDACVAADGCGHRPKDWSWGRGMRPVIDVSWRDTQVYLHWLSTRTGREYRLPSEAEWEYAARAGTETPYWWGEDVGLDQANCTGCGSAEERQTAPVGSFAANPFGLYDVHGNVWEWVEDCWHESYGGAPADASPWTNGLCAKRVLRGGAWNGEPRFVRSANRSRSGPAFRNSTYGFRVARSLD